MLKKVAIVFSLLALAAFVACQNPAAETGSLEALALILSIF